MTNPAHSKGATILVAEDDEDNRDILRTLLTLRGFEVLEAADGQQAVELARTACPDLILMDLKMPVMNGLAAARAIRQRPEPHLRAIPIVALSAYHPSQHGAVAFAAGCDDYVLKPTNYEHLEAVIDRLLKRATDADAEGQPLGDTLTA
jgi:CheY-like chemotaxis protein